MPVATPTKNGLMNKQYVVRETIGAGLLIDYNVDSDKLYTSSSLIELYVYSNSVISYYRVLSSPSSGGSITIRYIGINNCNFKYKDGKLYILPKSTDITIKYKVSLTRRLLPLFYNISISDFSNITGDIITPESD